MWYAFIGDFFIISNIPKKLFRLSTENKNFQPMNANFGILNCDKKIKDKVQKYTYLAERSLAHFDANNK